MLQKQKIIFLHRITFYKIHYTVLPHNSRFLGPGIFREFEIREFKIHDFPPNSRI